MAKKQPPSKGAATTADTISVRATQPHRYHGQQYDVGDSYDVESVNLGAVLGRGYAVRSDTVSSSGTARRTAQTAAAEDAAQTRQRAATTTRAAKTARAATTTRKATKRGRGR
jgi:hypothetical protein